MKKNIEEEAFKFVFNFEKNIENDYYCETRDIFQARLDKMINYLGSRLAKNT